MLNYTPFTHQRPVLSAHKKRGTCPLANLRPLFFRAVTTVFPVFLFFGLALYLLGTLTTCCTCGLLLAIALARASCCWTDFEDVSERGKYASRFFFCNTTHVRFFPTSHAFHYPLIYVGFPATTKGRMDGGSFFSVLPSAAEKNDKRLKIWRGFSPFTVDPAEYINPELPFDKKLDDVLTRNGYNPEDYPHTYLVTTPSFLGYAFKPVTYYYLYSASHALRLVVLEVNNTFSEGHIYILPQPSHSSPAPRPGYSYAATIPKEFHISPFNHRSGSYEIHMRDPLISLHPRYPPINVHMTVLSASKQKLMTVRVVSQASSSIQDLTVLKILKCSFVTFFAIPWTFYEAYQLWKKQTPVYTRPELCNVNSLRHPATSMETRVQSWFLRYLRPRLRSVVKPIPPHHIIEVPADVHSASLHLHAERKRKYKFKRTGRGAVPDGRKRKRIRHANQSSHTLAAFKSPAIPTAAICPFMEDSSTIKSEWMKNQVNLHRLQN